MWGETECKSVGKEKKCMCEGVCMVKVWEGGSDWDCKGVGKGRMCMCEGVCMLTGSKRPLLDRTLSQE